MAQTLSSNRAIDCEGIEIASWKHRLALEVIILLLLENYPQMLFEIRINK